MSQKTRYYQLVDSTTADMVGFFEDQAELDDVLLEDLTDHGADSVRSLVLLIGSETGPETTITGDDLVRYAEALARTPSHPLVVLQVHAGGVDSKPREAVIAFGRLSRFLPVIRTVAAMPTTPPAPVRRAGRGRW